MQLEDETLDKIRKYVKGEIPTPPGVQFTEKSGLLYRACGARQKFEEQLILPVPCREKVLKLAHTIPLAGHLGQKKTANRILKRCFWPRIFHDVKQYCQSCEECQHTAGKRYTPKAPLVNLLIIDVPFSRIAMDIYSENKYILVVCDYATHYPKAIPLKSIDTETIATKLMDLMLRVGIPNEILTDQGSNFTSKLLEEIYKMLGIRGIKTTPYHPQMDGMVERFNGTLKSMLRRCNSHNPKKLGLILAVSVVCVS